MKGGDKILKNLIESGHIDSSIVLILTDYNLCSHFHWSEEQLNNTSCETIDLFSKIFSKVSELEQNKQT